MSYGLIRTDLSGIDPDNIFSVDQLRRQCRTCELRQIFAKYLVSSASVNDCLTNRAYFTKAIKYIICQSNVDSNERLRDALKAAELHPIVSRLNVLVDFAYRTIVHDSTIDDVSMIILELYSQEKGKAKLFTRKQSH